MKTFKLFGLVLVTILLNLTACSGGDDGDSSVPTPTPETPKSEIKIDSSITSNGVTFKTEAGEQSITFNASENWTLSIAETRTGTSWVTPSATSGSKGSVTIKFTVTENTDYDDRSVSVTIKSGTASITFTITQKGIDALLVTTAKYEVPQAGGSIEVEVKANITYQVEIPESSKGWIKETTTRALTATKHTFEISANEEYDKREGEIIFKSGEKKDTVHVYQTGGAIIMLTKNEYAVSDKGETITVELKSNCEYEVQMPNVDWIKEETSRAASSHTLKYVIAPNEGYDSRSAKIIYFDKNSDLKETLTITQSQKDAIIISKKNHTVSSSENTIEIELNSNVEYEATIMGDATNWISQVGNSNSRGLVASKLYFKITENETYDSRMGKIVIYDNQQELTDTIVVMQKGLSNIMLAQREYTVESYGGTIHVELQSNLDFTVKMPNVNWITKIETRGLETHKFSYSIAKNKDYDNREAQIIYIDKNSAAADTLNIIQLQKNAIIISNKNVKVDSEGGNIMVKLSANVDFEIAMPSADWITKTDSRALKEHEVKFTIAKNESEEKRSAYVVFVNKNNGISDTLTIMQNPLTNLSLVQKEYHITSNGGIIDVEVKSNIDVSVKTPNVNWIVPIETKALNTHKFSYKITANETYDNRSARIIFYDKNSDIKDTLSITQAQKNALIVAQNKYSISSAGGTLDFNVSTNVDFSVSISADWIKQITSRGLTDKKLCFDVTENKTDNPREAVITLVADKLKQIITIEQAGAKKLGILENGVAKLTSAGTLKDVLGDQMLRLTSLKIEGQINGRDIKCLRQMLAGEEFSNSLKGNLISLDLSEATIVESEDIYYTYNSTPCTTANNRIEKYMFYQTYIKRISLPNNIETIETAAFSGSRLTSITIPNSVTDIKELAFTGCYFLTSVEIGNSVETIGRNAFYCCDQISSVTIPNRVKSIGNEAFKYCEKLSTVTCLSVNPPILGNDVFLFTNTLKVPQNCKAKYETTDWKSYFTNIIELSNSSDANPGEGEQVLGTFINGVATLKKAGTLASVLGDEMLDITSLKIIGTLNGNDIKSLRQMLGGNDYNNYEYGKLTSLDLTDVSIVEGGDYYYSNGKTHYKTSNDKIEHYMFFSCSNLQMILLPNSVTTIGNYAFNDCDALTSVTIGNSITKIELEAFTNCDALTSIYISDLAAWCEISGLRYIHFSDLYLNNELITNLVIPDGVTTIEDCAFANCDALTNVTIGNSVTKIKSNVFNDCDALTNVTIGDNVTTIDNHVFKSCK